MDLFLIPLSTPTFPKTLRINHRPRPEQGSPARARTWSTAPDMNHRIRFQFQLSVSYVVETREVLGVALDEMMDSSGFYYPRRFSMSKANQQFQRFINARLAESFVCLHYCLEPKLMRNYPLRRQLARREELEQHRHGCSVDKPCRYSCCMSAFSNNYTIVYLRKATY